MHVSGGNFGGVWERTAPQSGAQANTIVKDRAVFPNRRLAELGDRSHAFVVQDRRESVDWPHEIRSVGEHLADVLVSEGVLV